VCDVRTGTSDRIQLVYWDRDTSTRENGAFIFGHRGPVPRHVGGVNVRASPV